MYERDEQSELPVQHGQHGQYGKGEQQVQAEQHGQYGQQVQGVQHGQYGQAEQQVQTGQHGQYGQGANAAPTVRGDAMFRQELEQLQKVDFALVELTLYLDTHPRDMQALQQFNQLAQRRQQLARAFELKYGPLLQFGLSFSRYPWQWIETPWPWQV